MFIVWNLIMFYAEPKSAFEPWSQRIFEIKGGPNDRFDVAVASNRKKIVLKNFRF